MIFLFINIFYIYYNLIKKKMQSANQGNKTNPSGQPVLLKTEKILNFSGYVKVEKNGIEIKNKLLNSTMVSQIVILKKIYKDPEKEIKLLSIETKKAESVYSFELSALTKIVDRFSDQGKLTLMFQIKKDKYNIFISKSTKELLDNFVKTLRLHSGTNAVTVPSQVPNNSNTQSNSLQQPATGGKRKFHELYQKKNNINQFKTYKEIPQDQIIPGIFYNQGKKYLSEFPYQLLYQIFVYLDRPTFFTKVPFLNKEFKVIADSFIKEIKIKDDTPDSALVKIIKRFKNVKMIKFGKAKNFKNQTIRNLDVGLKQLEKVDMSEIKKLNKDYIRAFFHKMNSKLVNELKLNFCLESLEDALYYIEDFFVNLKKLSLDYSGYDYTQTDLNSVAVNTKFYHPNLYRAIILMLFNKKKHPLFKSLEIFLWNNTFNIEKLVWSSTLYPPEEEYSPYIFQGLECLSIDLILVYEVKDLNIFCNCEKLKEFRLGQIAIKSRKPNLTGNYSLTLIERTNLLIRYYKEEELEGNPEGDTFDFENDPLEVFGKIFYRMKNLIRLSLGSFLTDDLCKIISLYLKNIEIIQFNSDLVTDNGIKEVLLGCKKIRHLDLDGCSRFNGSCFYDQRMDFSNLKRGIFSITTHNFYIVLNYLRQKGIKVENYIRGSSG